MQSGIPAIAMDSPSTKVAESLTVQLKIMSNGHDATSLAMCGTNVAEDAGDDFVKSYRGMERELSRTASRVLENLKKGKRFNRVLVLGVYWEKGVTDREYIPQHADKLLDVFHKGYGYDVDKLVLGSEEAKADLNDKLGSL